MSLAQETVDQECVAARDRYAALSMKDAKLTFSYELQGFAAAMVEKGVALPMALFQITTLIDLLAKANDI